MTRPHPGDDQPAPAVDSAAADLLHMQHAARLALRGHGGAEPNPLVGCVVTNARGEVAGWGYHRRCGDAHAEVVALRRAGIAARGGTAFVTLEPCHHSGRTGPCTEALIAAGIRRVVFARPDPNPVARGGVARLRSAGIRVDHLEGCTAAESVSDPFVHRMTTSLPWVTAKWAQTLDGRIATRTGDNRWISSPASRRLVHRERARVDCILSAIGTVLADDPLLTARGVRVRRVARRVVIDPFLRTPPVARIVATARDAPTTIVCAASAIASSAPAAGDLQARGVELLPLDADGGEIPLRPLLLELARRHETAHVLVEAGPGLLGRLFRQRLVNDALVFVAPTILGDQQAPGPIAGAAAGSLADALGLELRSIRRRGGDAVLYYSVGD
jgi:diaminohydroxyphosphoribosylaminopyrimidine deaminase/5-amino-6-(5-phosphoribosylamino)uracil reductase